MVWAVVNVHWSGQLRNVWRPANLSTVCVSDPILHCDKPLDWRNGQLPGVKKRTDAIVQTLQRIEKVPWLPWQSSSELQRQSSWTNRDERVEGSDCHSLLSIAGIAPAKNGWAKGRWHFPMAVSVASLEIHKIHTLWSCLPGDCSCDYLRAADMLPHSGNVFICQWGRQNMMCTIHAVLDPFYVRFKPRRSRLFKLLLLPGRSGFAWHITSCYSVIIRTKLVQVCWQVKVLCFHINSESAICGFLICNVAVCNSHSSRYLPTIRDNAVQDEPAEDACHNTDAWKECGEVFSSVTLNCDEAAFFPQLPPWINP